MKKLVKLLPLLSAVIVNFSYSKTTIHSDTTKNHPDAELFAPRKIPGATNQVAAPAFSPDGKSVYFGESSEKKKINIMVSRLSKGKWSEPETASFSGDFPNLEPAFAPNGKYLVFASSRPVTPGRKNIDGNWGKKTYPGSGGNLWKVELTKNGWGTPVLLPEVINQNTSIFSPAVTADGSIYFMSPDTAGRFHIYRSQCKNGKYEPATPSSFSMAGYGDVDPAVAPDESFLIFSSGRPPALPHTADLYIVFKKPDGEWGEPINLRKIISNKVFGVEARLSPDLRTLYFSNQTNTAGITVSTDQYIWQVDISWLLKEHGLKLSKAK